MSAGIIEYHMEAIDEWLSAGIIEYHLEAIDEWRAGHRATAGMPSTGQNYQGAMLDAIARHERELIKLGHEATIDYVQIHGFADGQRGRLS